MASDIDGRDLDGVEAELAQLPGDERSAVGGPGLQAVVHSDSPGPQAGPGHLERRRRSEGKGIGPAAAGHEHQVTGREVAHGGAHSRAYGAYGAVGIGVGSTTLGFGWATSSHVGRTALMALGYFVIATSWTW